MQCPACQSEHTNKFGKDSHGNQRHKCLDCSKRWSEKKAPLPYKPLIRAHKENDDHFWCRWVETVPPHDDEPYAVKQRRHILVESPGRFADIKLRAKAEWDKDLREETGGAEVKESTEPCDVLVNQLLDEWEKVK